MKINYVEVALDNGVTDIGQILAKEMEEIKALVRCGVLKQGWNISYPQPKKYYAHSLYFKVNIVRIL